MTETTAKVQCSWRMESAVGEAAKGDPESGTSGAGSTPPRHRIVVRWVGGTERCRRTWTPGSTRGRDSQLPCLPETHRWASNAYSTDRVLVWLTVDGNIMVMPHR